MYSVSVSVQGISPLMQHRFPLPEFESLSKSGNQSTGEKDYSQEWRDYLYTEVNGQIYQPSSHFEAAMVKAAASFKIKGKGNKTYKDLVLSNIVVDPINIPHDGFIYTNDLVLDTDGDKPLYIDMRPVIIKGNRVIRLRPVFKAGWVLSFEILVNDDEIQPTLLHDVLALAGKAVGIGDYRPKFGRFMITKFEVHK